MRRVFNLKWLQWLFVKLPNPVRHKISRRFRTLSQQENRVKPPEIMDVTHATVEETMQTYDVSVLVHGHTHRPAIHEFELSNNNARRIVLGDWYEQDSVLIYTDNEQKLVSVEEYLDWR